MACRDHCEHRADRGDIVLGWLVRVVAGVAVAGVVLFDVISVGTARLSVEDQAGTAARAASETWAGHHDVQSAFDSAWHSAIEANPTNEIDPKTFRVDPDGEVHLTLHREAPTVLLHLVGPLREQADVHAVGTGRST